MADARAPSSTYLVTGLPRTRSAWLSAVLSTPDVPCIHSRADSPFAASGAYGLADPGAACLWPDEALEEFDNKPIVIVQRRPEASRQSFQRWITARGEGDIADDQWDRLVANYERFCGRASALVVPFEKLDDSRAVQVIVTYLTGERPPLSYVERMQLLDIQQRTEKAVTRRR